MNNLKRMSVFLMFVAAALLLGACAETKRARSVEPTGFFVDHSMLQEGEKDETLLRYVNPRADIGGYTKIMLDPTLIQKPDGASEAQLADLQKLATNFYYHMSKELGKDYRIVKSPEPGAIRIQAAITGARKSFVVGDTLSSVVPVGIGVSLAKDFITGKPMAVGETSMEVKATDAQTGELLGAAIDRRVGGKSFKGKFDSWSHANASVEYWAKRFRHFLCMERGGIECEMP